MYEDLKEKLGLGDPLLGFHLIDSFTKLCLMLKIATPAFYSLGSFSPKTPIILYFYLGFPYKQSRKRFPLRSFATLSTLKR